MKKLLLLSALIFGFSSAAFTELASPHRVYEFGLNVQAGVSNNYFRPDQILKEEIKIDLKKMAESFDDEGFVVDMEAGLDSYFKIDYSKNCRLKFFMGLDGAAYGNISRELFEMLGKGISANVEIGDGCWLGARSTVLPGVSIAKKNILAAGSVMTTSSEIEKSLWAGVPAKMKKQY